MARGFLFVACLSMSNSTKYVEVYTKQVDVAREFGVTEATVHNWIKAAEAGNNYLKTTKRSGKRYIVQNEHNRAEMYRLKEKGRKHTSNMNMMYVHADEDKLMRMFDEKNLNHFINYFNIHKKIPIKYGYFDGGAKLWDEYYRNTNYGALDKDTLDKTYHMIWGHLKKYKYVNIIDLGPGNSLSSLDFVERIKNEGRLLKYHLADISQDMLDIAKSNAQARLGEDKVTFSITDFETQSLQDTLFDLKKGYEYNEVCNMILFLGGNIGIGTSLEDQLRILSNIKDGMTYGDLLYTSCAYDKPSIRTIFPLSKVDSRENTEMLIVYALGLDDYHFTREFQFNEQIGCRQLNLILKYAITITFNDLGLSLELKKGDKINVYTHRRDSLELISEKTKLTGMELKFVYLNDTTDKIPEITYLASVA